MKLVDWIGREFDQTYEIDAGPFQGYVCVIQVIARVM